MNKISKYNFYPSSKSPSSYALVMDIEWYAHLTEIGLAIKALNSAPIYKHFKIKELLAFKIKYAPVPMKGFLFGTSEVQELSKVLSEIKYWLDGYTEG